MEPLKVRRKGDKIYLEGEFLDLENNSNGRTYELHSVIHQIKEIQHEVAKGMLLGELEPRERLEVSLAGVSHKVNDLWIDPLQKKLFGNLEILKETPRGQMAKGWIELEVPLSISMRASGQTNENGEIEIDKIYAFDLVKQNTNNMENYYIKEDNPKKKAYPPPPPIRKEDKELLIFVYYFNTGNMSEANYRFRIAEQRAILQREFKDVEEKTNYLIKFFVVPVKDQETKLECIFPKNQDDIDLPILFDEEKIKGFTLENE